MSYFNATKVAASGVQFTRPEVALRLGEYTLIDDCLDGESAIKRAGAIYLPDPSPAKEKEAVRKLRYATYLERAVFYNVTRYTFQGMLGQVFSKPITKSGPDVLANVFRSPSGDGTSIEQQAKTLVGYLIAHSRAGLLVDFPNTLGGASKEQTESGVVRPTITVYKASEIINWRVEDEGAEEVLKLVVLKEIVDEIDSTDQFKITKVTQYRVLRIDSETGGVIHEIWRTDKSPNAPVSTFDVLGFDSLPLKRIPFTFVGLSTNAIAPEAPAMLDLATMNLAHYRNSADHEESCFIAGQPMLAVAGLTSNWMREQFPDGIMFGSRAGLPLPAGGKGEILQAQPNTVVSESMLRKEEQMRAIGAKLIDSNSTAKTATESRIDATSEGGILSSAAINASAAYLWALKLSCALLGVSVTTKDDVSGEQKPTLVFEINSEFDISRMSADERREVVAAWQAGLIATEDTYKVYQKVGIATLPFDAARTSIEKDQASKMDNEVKQAKALADAVPVNNKVTKKVK